MKLRNLLTKLLKKTLIDRYYLLEVPRKGIWFVYSKYSILNSGELMKSNPFMSDDSREYFNFWEAMDDEHNIIRSKTWQELKELLTPNTQ